MGDPYFDPYQDMSEGDMINMYAQMNPSLFGNDPAKRLNMLQDLEQSLGFSLVQTAGTSNPAAEQYQPPMNQVGAIYGNDPVFASVFQSIEEDNDPISAAKAARDQGVFKGTNEDFTQLVEIATQYAGERVKNQQAEMSWQAENGGGWTMPDGSKAKQTPLGGNDIRGTASEYDLAGFNEDEMLKQYQKQFGIGGPRGRVEPGRGVSMSAGPARDGFGWTAGTGIVGAADPVAASLPMARPPANRIGTGDGQFQSIRDQNDPLVTSQTSAGGNLDNLIASVVAGAPKPNSTVGQPRQPKAAGERGDFFKMTDQLAQGSIDRRTDRAKNTRVRSDANRNAMMRIIALAGLMQGEYPQK